MLSALPRDIMQMLAADMWQVHDFFRVVATCRRLHTIYSSEELVFRKFSQSGIILCAGGPDVDQPAGDQMEQGATSTPDTDAASVDRPSTIIGHGIGHSTACPSEYAYLLPSIGPNASSPRARLALPRSTMLPRLSSPCTWKLLLRSLFTLARLPRLPITSLLHPASKEGVRSAAIVASTRDRKEQDIDKLLRLSDGPHNMLMWSSTGSPQRHRADAVEEDGRPIDDWLLFRSYTHPLSFLTRVRIKIFQCYYQPREPIFHPSYIRFKVGHDARKWEYTSPWYRCEEHAQCQDFYFYDPAQYHSPERHGPMMLISGSYLRVEFRFVRFRVNESKMRIKLDRTLTFLICFVCSLLSQRVQHEAARR
jgi:hypothetical protein